MNCHLAVQSLTVHHYYKINNTTMDTKRMSVKLMCGWFAGYVVSGVISLLYEFGPLQRGTVTDVKTLYILQVIGVAMALGLIPLALRGFKRMMDRLEEKDWSEERVARFYMTCSWLRLAAFFIVLVFGTLLYYLIDDNIGLYIAVIAAICSMFCFPTKAAVENETGFQD